MRIWDLFAGLDRAYGTYQVTDAEGKKLSGQARTVQQPLTRDVWELHLSGERSLGVIPIRDDNTVAFAAIDIDTYPLDLVALEAQIAELGLPLVVVRSKSGGAHLYLFIEEGIAAQVPAALIVMRISCAQTASTTNAAFSLCLSFCLFMLSILFQPVCIAHSLCAFLQLTVRTLTACAVHCACSRCRIHLCTHGGCRSKVPTPIGTRSQPALRNIDCEPSWNRC